MSGRDGRILNPGVADDQLHIRKVFSNPLVVFVGVVCALLSVCQVWNYFVLLAKLKAASGDAINVDPTLLAFFHIPILLALALPILISIAFFQMFAASKNYSHSTIPKSGIKTLFAGAIVSCVFSGWCIVFIIIVLFKIALAGILNEWIVLPSTIIILLLFFYSISFILFANAVRSSLSFNVLVSTGAVLWGVMNIILAVIFLMITFALEYVGSQLGDNQISGMFVFYIIMNSIAYALMAAFAFVCKTAAGNADPMSNNCSK